MALHYYTEDYHTKYIHRSYHNYNHNHNNNNHNHHHHHNTETHHTGDMWRQLSTGSYLENS